MARMVPIAEGGPERNLVSADCRAVTSFDALRHLTEVMNWNLHVESDPLENDLRSYTVDLDLGNQDPRVVGQLLAVSAGADVVFDPGEPGIGRRPTLHVTRKPSGETGSGRNRLRELAAQWYRSFLVDGLRHEPLVESEEMRVRMDLGQLMIESGDLEASIPFFAEIYDKRPGPYVSKAVLRIAQAQMDLASGSPDSSKSRAYYVEGEKWARRLLETYPSSPEATGATITLGRALLGQAEVASDPDEARDLCNRCRRELAARVMRLLDTVEMLDVWLLVGQAQFRLEQPVRVYETMLTLRESPNFDDLSERQFLDYHFLLGYGALGEGKADLSMRSLEWFLIHCENDRRRGLANVLLADAYLRLDRFIEARAASISARERFMGELEPHWRSRTLRLWARTALGEKELAFQELEVLAYREDDPELVLFLVDELSADHQWQRAISAARILLNGDGAFADAARFKTVQAFYQQADASKNFAEFPARACEIATQIIDRDLRSQCSEMIGDAYTAIGKPEAAADAYRGILR